MFLRQKSKQYLSDQSGHYTIMTAILGLPLIIGISAAMDFSSAQSEYNSVKNAVDNAVLAAATNNAASKDKKKNIAELHFAQNYKGRANVKANAIADDTSVSMVAEGLVPFSISEALGVDGVQINVSGKAVTNAQNVICVLGLATEGNEAIQFTSELKFKAPNCTVHSNSSSATSMVSNGEYAPIAKSFCAVGGVSGSFSPFAKGECGEISDPYVSTPPPSIGACMPDSVYDAVGEPLSHWEILRRVIEAAIDYWEAKKEGEAAKWSLDLIPDSGNLTGSNAVLYPGTYCNGLTVDGTNVTFMPGEYVIKDGPLTFKNFAEAEAKNDTFGFTGIGSTLRVEKGADVYVKAPSSGKRKGLAFMEMPGAGGQGVKPGMLASMITSGGTLNVLGTVYFPRQKLIVSGSGTKMGSQAPATSFIGYNVIFEGEEDSVVTVRVDHRSAGLPPIVPRAEEGAILVE